MVLEGQHVGGGGLTGPWLAKTRFPLFRAFSSHAPKTKKCFTNASCTPEDNCCDINSGIILLCNWNEIFLANISLTILQYSLSFLPPTPFVFPLPLPVPPSLSLPSFFFLPPPPPSPRLPPSLSLPPSLPPSLSPSLHPLFSMEKRKPIKKNHVNEFGGRNAPEASQAKIRDVLETPDTFGPIYLEIPIQGAECPRDRRDIWRDRWDMSMGQMGHTPGTQRVSPEFFMFTGSSLSPFGVSQACLDTNMPSGLVPSGNVLGHSWGLFYMEKGVPLLRYLRTTWE